MSESRTQLENILELLLAEENDKAEEMLHEYVVAKARAEYEKVLDEDVSEEDKVEEAEESDEDAVEETVETDEDAVEEAKESEEDAVEENYGVDEVIDQSNDFEADVSAEETGEFGDDENADELDMEDGEDQDLEDKVDDIEAELDDLKAEFEKLLADDDESDMEDGEEAEMDAMPDEMDLESVEYDLDDEVAEGNELEEATKLSNTVATPKAPNEDSKDGMKMPAPSKIADGSVKAPVLKDGGEGNKGESAKDHTPTDNINVEPKKA